MGHYTIQRKLGDGGMGVVYEAVDANLDRAVALKVLPADVSSSAVRNQRFIQEAKAASALNHPNIVTIYEIASVDGIAYIAMELIRGRTLDQLLSSGRASLADTLKFGGQIANAMSAAHDAGIVHRDLKPSNIMINERGDVKVVDFGLAKLSSPEGISQEDATRTAQAVTQEGSVLGTAAYMSPEQVEARKVDARSDIFSFGALLYEMATGKSAFGRPTLIATFAAVLKDEPKPASSVVDGLPPSLDRTIAGCLAKDSQRRTPSMATVQQQLREIEGVTLADGPAPPSLKHAKTQSRYLVAALSILLALAAAGAFLFRPGRHPAPAFFQASVLTSFVGQHGTPSLSPDGNQFVFEWDGDVPNGKPHLYLSLVGKGTPLRLTPENEFAAEPEWSPDGQSIAFVERNDSGSYDIAVIPALGGAERRVATGPSLSSVSWSPDSHWLLWCEGTGILIAPAGGGEARHLIDTGAAKGYGFFVISPDGRQIVYERVAGDFDSDLFVSGFHDGNIAGQTRQITFDHVPKSSAVWTAGGTEIVYVVGGPYTSEAGIRRIPTTGGVPETVQGIGTNASELTYSYKAHRLLYSTFFVNYDIHRLDMRNPRAKPERFLSSNRFDSSPSYSPDGKRIAFDSNRGGTRQIWVADADGTNPSPLTAFKIGVTGSGRWSPDGQSLAFDARPESDADVYTIPASGGPVRKLTDFREEDHNGVWSADGKWIYFSSRRLGHPEIFRMHSDGSGVQQMTNNGGILPNAASDGKWLYYTVLGKGIWKMPADGGAATQVLTPQQAASS